MWNLCISQYMKCCPAVLKKENQNALARTWEQKINGEYIYTQFNKTTSAR